MSNLVISIFESESLAEKARRSLLEKDRDDSLGIADAVIVERTAQGDLKLHHASRFTLGGAVGGAFLGLLFGILLLNPVFALAGIVIGLIIGTVSGSSAQTGIDAAFARTQVEGMEPGGAALCVLDGTHIERIVAEIQSLEGNTRWTKKCELGEEQKRCSLWETGTSLGSGLPVL